MLLINYNMHLLFQKMADVLDISISMKCLNKGMTNHFNPLISDPEEYFCVTIAIPYFYSFVQQLNERFLCHKNIFKGQLFILFIIYNLIKILFIEFHSWFSGSYSEDFGEIVQFYLDTNERTVLSELHLWHAILKKNEEHSKNS